MFLDKFPPKRAAISDKYIDAISKDIQNQTPVNSKEYKKDLDYKFLERQPTKLYS